VRLGRRVVHKLRPAREHPITMRSEMGAVHQTAEIQQSYAGSWVAIVDGQVIEARENPHALAVALHDRGVTAATIMRCPALNEPELVGLG
jgi:hypothetical protein